MGIYDKTSLKLKLTPNFALGEFVRSEHIDELTPPVLKQLEFLTQRMQVVRDIIGRPIKITSGWRPDWYNKKIGGSSSSYHVKGMACDWTTTQLKEVAYLLRNWEGGFNYYVSSNFIHTDIRPNKARW